MTSEQHAARKDPAETELARRERSFFAAAIGAFTALSFSAMAVSGRAAMSAGVSPFLAIALRACCGLVVTSCHLCLMPISRRTSELQQARSHYWLLFLRGPFGWMAITGLFWSFSDHTLSLGDIAALYQTAPFWCFLLGWLCFGQRVRQSTVLAACCSVLGVGLIARPTFIFPIYHRRLMELATRKMIASGVVLTSAFGAAAAYSAVQALTLRKVSLVTQIHYNMVFQTVVGAITVLSTGAWRTVPELGSDAGTWAALMLVVVTGLAGQFGTVKAVSLDSATTFSITQELNVALGFAWDVLVFKQPVSSLSVTGAALICLGVLILFLYPDSSIEGSVRALAMRCRECHAVDGRIDGSDVYRSAALGSEANFDHHGSDGEDDCEAEKELQVILSKFYITAS